MLVEFSNFRSLLFIQNLSMRVFLSVDLYFLSLVLIEVSAVCESATYLSKNPSSSGFSIITHMPGKAFELSIYERGTNIVDRNFMSV